MDTHDPAARAAALRKVDAPALGLMVGAGIGAALCLLSVAGYFFGMVGLPMLGDAEERAVGLLFSIWGVLWSLLSVGLCSFVIWAATRLRGLQSYPLALAAAAISVVPCLTPCCPISLPFGIWALIVMHDPAVRPHFRG